MTSNYSVSATEHQLFMSMNEAFSRSSEVYTSEWSQANEQPSRVDEFACKLGWSVGGISGHTTALVSVLLLSRLQAFRLLVTGRVMTGIKITQQAILRFVASQGRHDSPISVKCQISRWDLDIWGFHFRPKKTIIVLIVVPQFGTPWSSHFWENGTTISSPGQRARNIR